MNSSLMKVPQNIFVSGANGFIGSSLVIRLLQDGHTVIGYGRSPKGKIKNEQYHYISGDLCSDQNLSTVLRDYQINTIYHLAAATIPKEGVENAKDDIAADLFPTIALLDAAVKANVKRFVFPSSGGTVYGEGQNTPHKENEPLHPECIYAANKAAIEGYLNVYSHMSGLQCYILRITNPYGYCSQSGRKQGIVPIAVEKLFSDQPVAVYGDTVRDYLYIDDLTNALVKILNYCGPERIFNIGTGTGTHLTDIIHKIEDISGKSFVEISHFERRSCDVYENILNVSHARNELNWSANTDLDQGIKKVLNQVNQT